MAIELEQQDWDALCKAVLVIGMSVQKLASGKALTTDERARLDAAVPTIKGVLTVKKKAGAKPVSSPVGPTRNDPTRQPKKVSR
jgi:hypothetical protein